MSSVYPLILNLNDKNNNSQIYNDIFSIYDSTYVLEK